MTRRISITLDPALDSLLRAEHRRRRAVAGVPLSEAAVAVALIGEALDRREDAADLAAWSVRPVDPKVAGSRDGVEWIERARRRKAELPDDLPDDPAWLAQPLDPADLAEPEDARRPAPMPPRFR